MLFCFPLFEIPRKKKMMLLSNNSDQDYLVKFTKVFSYIVKNLMSDIIIIVGRDRGAGDREKRGREVYGRREKRGREAGFPR